MRTEPYNSASLQAKFPEVYREFFASSELVVSCPVTFMWAGNASSRFGLAAVTQRLPLRMYIACESTPRVGEVRMGSLHQWDKETNTFTFIPQFYRIELQVELNNYLAHLPWCRERGWIIHVLSEAPIHSGFANDGALVGALAGATLLLGNETNPKDLLTALHAVSSQRHEHGGVVDVLMKRAIKIGALFCGFIPGFARTAGCLIGDRIFPSIGWSTYRPDMLKDAFIGSGKLDDLAVVDTMEWQSYMLDEFFAPLPKATRWPIDILLVRTGVDSAGRITIFLRQKQDFLRRLVPEKYRARMKDVSMLDDFVSHTLLFAPDDPWQIYLAVMGVVTARLVKDIYDTVARHTDTAIKFLAKSMHHYDETLGLISLASFYHTGQVVRLKEELRRVILEETPTVIPGIKIAGSGLGGDLIVTAPAGILRERFSDILKTVSQRTGVNVDADHLSWIDGFEQEAFKVEYAPQAGIQHTLIPQGRSLVTTVAADDTIHRMSVTKLDSGMADIVMDEVNEKLWVGGKTVTPAEIPSQRMAIILVKLLVKSGKWRLANTDLPESSYSEYRNELQSKVIGRLKRLCDQRLKKELMLGIEGSLTKFDIVWSPDEVTLAIREKV